MKRVGLSGNGHIQMKSGSISCGSYYCGTSFPSPRDQQNESIIANSVAISNELESVDEFIPKLEEAISNKVHSKMQFGSGLQGYFGNYQGNSLIYGDDVQLELSNFEADKFLIKADKGHVKVSVSRIGSEGVIYMNSGLLELGLDEKMAINIYNVKEKKFTSEGGYQFGKPLLVLQLGEDVQLKVTKTKKMDLFAQLKEKYARKQQ